MDSPFATLAISLGLGLLVGLQRERTDARLAGIRTFAIITLLGTASAMLADAAGGWVIGAGLAGVAAATVVGNLYTARVGPPEPGITTEVAILAMFVVGAMLHAGPRDPAVAVGAAVALLLHAKPILHGLARRLGDRDIRAIMQFALMSLIILPVVPDGPAGPYGVLNPHRLWLMVVLVVGISLAGYLALKLTAGRGGVALAAVLGGLVSSTATTAGFARRAGADTSAAPAAALAISLAHAVMLARVIVVVTIVAPGACPSISGPIGVLLAAAGVTAAVVWRRTPADSRPPPEATNPAELRPALVFGAIYAAVLVLVAAARDRAGDAAIYAVSALGGLTDMDAITLSTARLAASGQAQTGVVWRAIVVAGLANTVFKATLSAWLGGAPLARRIIPVFGTSAAAAAGVLLLWR